MCGRHERTGSHSDCPTVFLLFSYMREARSTKSLCIIPAVLEIKRRSSTQKNTHSRIKVSVKPPDMHHRLALLLLSPFLSFILVKSVEGGCTRPDLGPHVEAPGLQLFSPPGTALHLTCAPGYTGENGPAVTICTTLKSWSTTHFVCQPMQCPAVEPPINGAMYFEDNVYLSTINFTCNKGYILHGASSAVCQENTKWSTSSPECKAVTCGLPPVPEYGFLEFDIPRASMEHVEFGVKGTYKCLPPRALIGNPRAECTIYGNWTKAPVCQTVTCPPPEPIEHGHMPTITKVYTYDDTIKYGCTGYYTVVGNPYVQCLKTGQWSPKPACSAPCSVDIRRGRILYNGRKLWIEDLNPNKVYHDDIVSFYCMNVYRNCGYAMPSQCINGILRIPECFKEPSHYKYNFQHKTLPSEIQQC